MPYCLEKNLKLLLHQPQKQAQEVSPISGPGASPFSDEQTHSSQSQAQRERLLKSNYLLESSSSRLDSSHRIALETEDLGTGILRDLRGQREQIEGTRDTVRTLIWSRHFNHTIHRCLCWFIMCTRPVERGRWSYWQSQQHAQPNDSTVSFVFFVPSSNITRLDDLLMDS